MSLSLKTSWDSKQIVLKSDFGGNRVNQFLHVHSIILTPVSLTYEYANSNYPTPDMPYTPAVRFHWTKPLQANSWMDIRFVVANLILQTLVVPAVYTKVITMEDKIQVRGFATPDTDFRFPKDSNMFDSFWTSVILERDNARFAFGGGSTQYAIPNESTRGGLSQMLGDFDLPIPSRYRKIDWDFQNDPDLNFPKITSQSKIALNMSFGKESIFTYGVLKKLGFQTEDILLTVFNHGNDYQAEYVNLIKQEPFRQHDIQIIGSNYLTEVLEPYSYRKGMPSHGLSHIMQAASALANCGNCDFVLNGDEYECYTPSTFTLSKEEGPIEVYSYTLQQTPVMSNLMNNARLDDDGEFYGPVIGSLLYGLTWLQIQMALDSEHFIKYDQLSCLLATPDDPVNCGQCAKCVRVMAKKLPFSDLKRYTPNKPNQKKMDTFLARCNPEDHQEFSEFYGGCLKHHEDIVQVNQAKAFATLYKAAGGTPQSLNSVVGAYSILNTMNYGPQRPMMFDDSLTEDFMAEYQEAVELSFQDFIKKPTIEKKD